MENLFSYGTLQLKQVQQELFGRTVPTSPDVLSGYKKETIKIKVESVVSLSGEEEHVIISYTGNSLDIIEGVILSITQDELNEADKYETNDYKRINVHLQSGKTAWVYVKTNKE
jgi:gamma-glutamylcyclotransferase (GGCT)/AIG2-like uncharacterized protein YtfP